LPTGKHTSGQTDFRRCRAWTHKGPLLLPATNASSADGGFVDPGRLANALGVACGPDQDYDGVEDIYVGQPGAHVGVHVYSGRTGAYVRYLNNDAVRFIAVHPAPEKYTGSSIPASVPDTKLVYSYNCDEYGNWYLAPGVTFPAEWGIGWSLYDDDPKPWGGRMAGSFAQSTTLGLRNLPPHTSITVSFDLILLGISGDKWDGQGVPGDTNPDRFRSVVIGAGGMALESFSQDAGVVQSYPYGAGGVTYPGLTGSTRQTTSGSNTLFRVAQSKLHRCAQQLQCGHTVPSRRHTVY
jgi:hypothetical protein